jgi:SulP family sulfate permease
VCSIAVAKMYAVKYGYDVNPSSELKALGLTNMGGSVVQSFLVMGAFGRSAVNESSGARSQMSGIVAAFVVVLLLLVVMPALFYLPKVSTMRQQTSCCITWYVTRFVRRQLWLR